mmetsp:Transcript_62524/g.162230  ORF Transcript_62524/g.162230 Transcript_62524/m.162230 type:complete len:221 (+) Transcript_62524:506-1168(+)
MPPPPRGATQRALPRNACTICAASGLVSSWHAVCGSTGTSARSCSPCWCGCNGKVGRGPECEPCTLCPRSLASLLAAHQLARSASKFRKHRPARPATTSPIQCHSPNRQPLRLRAWPLRCRCRRRCCCRRCRRTARRCVGRRCRPGPHHVKSASFGPCSVESLVIATAGWRLRSRSRARIRKTTRGGSPRRPCSDRHCVHCLSSWSHHIPSRCGYPKRHG